MPPEIAMKHVVMDVQRSRQNINLGTTGEGFHSAFWGGGDKVFTAGNIVNQSEVVTRNKHKDA